MTKKLSIQTERPTKMELLNTAKRMAEAGIIIDSQVFSPASQVANLKIQLKK